MMIKFSVRKVSWLLLAVAVAIGMWSCNKDDGHMEGVYPIIFNCKTLGSKAVVNSADALQNDVNGFMAYAYYEINSNSLSFDKNVTYDASLGWKYDGVQYWLPGANYWFKAFYPKPEGYVLTVNNADSEQSYTISNYDITTQKDLLVARAKASVATGEDAPITGSVVKFAFDHILACVSIKLKSELTGVTVNNVSLSSIAKIGTCNNGNWNYNGTTDISKSSGVTLEVNAQDFVDVTDGGFLVIPNSVDGSQEVKIETSHKTYTATIPEITWLSGKKYTYTMVIKQDNIIFNEPTVVEWDSENATGSVIIK